MRVVVPARRAVDPPERLDDLEHVRGPFGQRRRGQIRRQTPEVFIGDVVSFRQQRGIAGRRAEAERVESCGEVSVPADCLYQVHRADDFLIGEVGDLRRGLLRGGPPLLEECPCLRIDRGRILPVFVVELEHVSAIEPGELLPPRHNPSILQK
jgi:hypothetical protein